MHDKVSILITEGIETMYSFETEKGRRNEEVIFQSEKKKKSRKKGRMNKDKKYDGRNKSKYISNHS